MRRILLICFLAAAATARAQQTPAPPPTAQPLDSPRELDKLKDSCFGLKSLASCAEELFTGIPVHIAVGSIAPQNGFGAGVAYVAHKTTDDWRVSWNADAIGSINGSWRAGIYLKFVHTPIRPLPVRFGQPPAANPGPTELPEHTVFNVYAQTIALNKLSYFGLGPSSAEAGRSFYGLRETIVGANVVKPVYARLHAALYGEMNGRFIDIRPSLGQPSPSIAQLYSEGTAPGLANQPGTIQFGEGIRVRPVFFDDFLRLNYSLAYQQFFAPANSVLSFQRVTVDLSHQFAIYRKTTRFLLPSDTEGPDECSAGAGSECTINKYAAHPECSKDKTSQECAASARDRQGSFGLRFFLAASMTPGGEIVPFYFQPTLGGSDINGNVALSSYQDFRFRAPNVVLLRESFEHSIWGPLGFSLMADEGNVALTRGDLFHRWVHSFSAGLTLRAGGFPQVSLLFSWGGREGTHTIASVNTSLLGGSTRPALF